VTLKRKLAEQSFKAERDWIDRKKVLEQVRLDQIKKEVELEQERLGVRRIQEEQLAEKSILE